MTKSRTATPLIVAVVLLLLPFFYVASYLAIVEPFHQVYINPPSIQHYRVAGVAPIYWPLEQIDRELRPAAWR